jgi:hypothetical protein
MTRDKLPRFRDAFVAFCTAVAGLNNFGAVKSISALLASHMLLPDAIVENYTVAPSRR